MRLLLRGEGPHELPQKRSLALVSILQRLAAAEIAKALRLRDFRSLAIFEFLTSEPEMEPHTSDYVREDHPATSIVARPEPSLIALDQCGSSCLQAIDADMRICGNPN